MRWHGAGYVCVDGSNDVSISVVVAACSGKGFAREQLVLPAYCLPAAQGVKRLLVTAVSEKRGTSCNNRDGKRERGKDREREREQEQQPQQQEKTKRGQQPSAGESSARANHTHSHSHVSTAVSAAQKASARQKKTTDESAHTHTRTLVRAPLRSGGAEVRQRLSRAPRDADGGALDSLALVGQHVGAVAVAVVGHHQSHISISCFGLLGPAVSRRCRSGGSRRSGHHFHELRRF